jgi:hypothetical protein
MYRTKDEKHELIELIFSKREFFEEYVLEVLSDIDRLDIMEILSKRFIEILLKDELNFLYMKNFDNFNFSLIKNILFKEIANEWVFFAQEELMYTKEEALDIIQNKKRVLFLLALVKWYFTKYKKYFTDKIADSFIKLVESMPNATLDNPIIKTVLKSNFVKNKNLSVVHNYDQLYNRVKDARNNKNEQLSKEQIKVSELYIKLQTQNYIKEDVVKIKSLLKKVEYNIEVLEEKELANFDDAVKRVRDTMSGFMLGIDSFKEA